MDFMTSIVGAIYTVSDWFYAIYLEAAGWIWPFNLAAPFFYQLSVIFLTLGWHFYHFSSWVSDVADKVQNIVSWSTIWSYIIDCIPNLIEIRDWFYSWASNVTGAVDIWWSDTKATVQGWIDTALQTAKDLTAAVSKSLTTLQEAWDNFKGKIPNLDEIVIWWKDWWAKILTFLTPWWNERLKEVDTLIVSTLKRWFPFYDDLVKLWDDIKLFFTNPLTWLVKKLEDWFWTEEVE